jgi:hypothetical protein
MDQSLPCTAGRASELPARGTLLYLIMSLYQT